MSGTNWHRYTTQHLQVMLAEYRKKRHGKQYVEEIEKELANRGEGFDVNDSDRS